MRTDLRLSAFMGFCLAALLAAGSGAALAQSPPMPAGVRIVATDELGPLYADARGFTLYTSRSDDKPNQSVCNAERHSAVLGQGQNPGFLPDHQTRPTCEEAWPPLRPSADDRPVGAWGIMTRHDGSRQWTHGGKPVYRSSYDRNPGDITGMSGGFYARAPLFAPPDVPAGVSARITQAGFLLTNSAGMSLYVREGDEGECSGACAQQWRPFHAPAMLATEALDGGWSVRETADGARQWVRDGKALFTHVLDRVPGDVRGRDLPGWRAAVLSPPLQPPADITRRMTIDGEVFADKGGMTLYTWHCTDESPDFLPCDVRGASQVYRLGTCGTPENCMATWRPVIASPGSSPVGNTWTIIPIDPTGANQFEPEDPAVEPIMVWAYHGSPVYTYAGDDRPGDIWGHGVRAFVRWGFTMIKTDLSDRTRF